jgi:hypothetical protein
MLQPGEILMSDDVTFAVVASKTVNSKTEDAIFRLRYFSCRSDCIPQISSCGSKANEHIVPRIIRPTPITIHSCARLGHERREDQHTALRLLKPSRPTQVRQTTHLAYIHSSRGHQYGCRMNYGQHDIIVGFASTAAD